ncbi:MAG: hypothetical protein KAT16_00380 [Candidatus Heimdallarchaeota archaeon]|nr:hypothetical protein [Candidatus Heimdallarchaeota archaeon]
MSKIENLKKSIRTILDQFPKYDIKFELSERELIYEFLAVINQFEEADNKRVALINHFSQYSEKVMKTSEYLTTPFLWYTVSVAEQAIINLSISRFHALEFYKFLLYQLRELYQLMKKGIKLSSYKYDRLQAKCEKADFILTSDEFEILKTTYSTIENDKSESLRSKHTKRKIIDNTAISSKYKRESAISRFYTLVGGKWRFLFRSSSFGLCRVFFHIQLATNIELKQIIDFKNSDNTVLGLSEVHHIPDFKNEYLGTLLVPNGDIDILHDYFKHCEEKNFMKIKDFAPIIRINRSSAFTLYKPDIGWQIVPKKSCKSIIRSFHPGEIQELSDNEVNDINNPIIPPKWSFTEYPHPQDIIKFYCKSPDQFSYSQLPLDRRRADNKHKFSIAEIGLLRYLINKKALEVGFAPWRLINNYSVKEYCIKLPKTPLKNLVQFFNVIPYGEIYFSDQNTYIWTFLPEELITLIKNDLKRTILPIVRSHPISEMNLNWFDDMNLQWITPKVIQI